MQVLNSFLIFATQQLFIDPVVTAADAFLGCRDVSATNLLALFLHQQPYVVRRQTFTTLKELVLPTPLSIFLLEQGSKVLVTEMLELSLLHTVAEFTLGLFVLVEYLLRRVENFLCLITQSCYSTKLPLNLLIDHR